MRTVLSWSGIVLANMALIGATLSGCSQEPTPEPGAGAQDVSVDDHSGWWCPEHGVPEEVCAQCNSALAAEFQQKGDWCEEHNRPESQCFLCDPTRAEKFAAEYEAKYGKKPPTSEGV